MMKKKLKQMISGWSNHLSPNEKRKKIISYISDQRLEICRTCEWHSDNKVTTASKLRPDKHCTHCGCTLTPKTKCLECECPIFKWGPVDTSVEE